MARVGILSPKVYRDMDEDDLLALHNAAGNAVLQASNNLTAQNFPSEAIHDLIPRTDDGKIFFGTLAEMARRGRDFADPKNPTMLRDLGKLVNFPFEELLPEEVPDFMAGDEWDGLNPGDDGVS